ncbi:MAG: membrane protein [Planctomycetota bacterium]|jgi:membrane protein
MRRKISDYVWGYNAWDTHSIQSFWRKFLQIMVTVVADLVGGMINLWAMSLVYTSLLSVVPLFAVSLWVVNGLGMQELLQPVLIRLLEPLGENSIEISATVVELVKAMDISVLGVLGLSFLVFTAVSLIYKIDSAFNNTWQLKASRNLLRRFSDYLSVILIGPVLVTLAIAITASLANNEIIEGLNQLSYMNDVLRLVGKVLPFVLAISAFTLVYLLVPNTRVKFSSAFYGGFFAGTIWQTSGIVFAALVGGSNGYTAIYSGFAFVLTSLIWIYLSWFILLVGASISFYHQRPERLNWRRQGIHLSARMREKIGLQAMVNIGQSHDQQSTMPATLENLSKYQQLPQEVLERMLNALEADKLILKSGDLPVRYLPVTAIHRIQIVDILRSARDAEDRGPPLSFRIDEPVERLLDGLNDAFDSHLGPLSLADFLLKFENLEDYESSVIQR